MKFSTFNFFWTDFKMSLMFLPLASQQVCNLPVCLCSSLKNKQTKSKQKKKVNKIKLHSCLTDRRLQCYLQVNSVWRCITFSLVSQFSAILGIVSNLPITMPGLHKNGNACKGLLFCSQMMRGNKCLLSLLMELEWVILKMEYS